MTRPCTPDLLLSKNEVKKIRDWSARHGYGLDHGYFELQYGFWIFEPEVHVCWIPKDGGDGDALELRDQMDARDAATDLAEFDMEGVKVPLVLKDSLAQAWVDQARARTAAELDGDCEPSGSDCHIRIKKSGAEILMGDGWMRLDHDHRGVLPG